MSPIKAQPKLSVGKANPAREWECNKLPLQGLLSSVSNIVDIFSVQKFCTNPKIIAIREVGYNKFAYKFFPNYSSYPSVSKISQKAKSVDEATIHQITINCCQFV